MRIVIIIRICSKLKRVDTRDIFFLYHDKKLIFLLNYFYRLIIVSYFIIFDTIISYNSEIIFNL